MTDIPQDAPRSEDGQWWWDGSTWQPVANAGADPAGVAPPAQGSSGAAATTTSGQFSDDGQWQWDGSQWQPVAGAGGAPGSAPAAETQPATGEKGSDAQQTGLKGSEPTLYEGDLDVDGWVETLQLALARAGHQVTVDGKFGSHTKEAVVAYQQEQGLEPDGVVGNATWAALMQREAESPGVHNPPHGGLYPAHDQAAAPTAATAPQPTVDAAPSNDAVVCYALDADVQADHSVYVNAAFKRQSSQRDAEEIKVRLQVDDDLYEGTVGPIALGETDGTVWQIGPVALGSHHLHVQVLDDNLEPVWSVAVDFQVPKAADPGAGVAVTTPTGADLASGREAMIQLIDHARAGAQKFASLSNEWATYDGNAEGAGMFEEMMKDLAEDDWVGVSVEFVKGFFNDLGAANAAGDVTRLKWEYLNPFMDGFLAGLGHGSAAAGENKLLANVAPSAQAAVAALGADVIRGIEGELVWVNPQSTSYKLNHPDEADSSAVGFVLPDYLWEMRTSDSYIRDGLHSVIWDRDN